jgi:hypothetical protein
MAVQMNPFIFNDRNPEQNPALGIFVIVALCRQTDRQKNNTGPERMPTIGRKPIKVHIGHY